MLVLSRKAGQRVQIGDNITLSVLGVRGQRIRLGIQAPRDVPVKRRETLLAAGSGPTIDPVHEQSCPQVPQARLDAGEPGEHGGDLSPPDASESAVSA